MLVESIALVGNLLNKSSLKIIVTGGLGYIGAHVTTLLLEKGHEVVCVDNLSNTRIEVLDGIEAIAGQRPIFESTDISDTGQVESLFKKHQDTEGIIHFAALKSVGESVQEPIQYYKNNIGGLLTILDQVTKMAIPLIFSSSCTVYGQASVLPINESAPLQTPSSPYGFTKQMGEQIIQDACKIKDGFNAILLRYFNPIGAHPSAQIGEFPLGVPQNLVPFLTQTVIGKHSVLKVFGSDYNTPDGTCIRDYIHVMDLAVAHIDALDYLLESRHKNSCEVFNVGTGRGVSVLELVAAFEKATGVKVPYELSPRREGDTVAAYAEVSKIANELGWKAKFSLEEALASAWKWEQQIQEVL